MSVDPQTQSLFDAIAAGNYNRVKLLIDSGVAIDRPNERGQTPLAVACHQGNVEIVDLLLAAGAQMQALKSNPQPQLDSVLPVNNSQVADPPGDRLRKQQIPFESLIDLIHQPANNTTEIEPMIPARQPLVPEQHNTDLQRISANWQDFNSDAEATYAFDLDEAFAANDADNSATLDRMDMFVDTHTMISLQRPATEVEFEAGETYAFDLSPDLDRLTIEANEEPDRLSMPMDRWEDSITYVLDNLPQLEPQIDIDRTDLPLAATGNRFGAPQERRKLLEVDPDRFEASATWEDGETYAIDLDDLSSHELTFGNPAVKSEPHLLGDLDANLFPASQSGATSDKNDSDYYDPDTQTSTDIFGTSKTRQDDLELAPIYEENATNTSLMAAVIDGDLDLAQQAIEAGASLDRYDWQ